MYNTLIETLINAGAHKATKYLEPNKIVRAVRTLQGKKIVSPRLNNIEITLTIGRPNYLERDFIKQCKKAGEPFPVKNIQLKYPPAQKQAPKKKINKKK